MLVESRWLHPLVSSSLLWVIVGAITGLCGYAARDQRKAAPGRESRLSFLMAILWASSGAVCAGGAWAASLGAGWFWLVAHFSPRAFEGAALIATGYATLGAVYGLLVGGIVGFVRGKGERLATALVLGSGGAFFGALGGGLSVLAVALAGPRVHPIVSSSLAWAAVGFAMGMSGYAWSRFTAARVEPPELDEDEPQPEAKTIQWLLRERKRRWRDRSLARVSPVLIASVWALAGAAIFAPSDLSLGLLAVGVLGLAVALVLYNQDARLCAIEDRFRHRRDS
jgi:hypothetical protein